MFLLGNHNYRDFIRSYSLPIHVSIGPLHIPPLALSVHVLVASPESTNVALQEWVATVPTGIGEVTVV